MNVEELKTLFRSIGLPVGIEVFNSGTNGFCRGVNNQKFGDDLIERNVGCLQNTFLVYATDRPLLLFCETRRGIKFDVIGSFKNRSGKNGCMRPLVYVDDDNISFFLRGEKVYNLLGVEENVNLGVIAYHDSMDLEVVSEEEFRKCINDHFYPASVSNIEKRNLLVDRLCSNLSERYGFNFNQMRDCSEWRFVSNKLYNSIAKL